jgi:hypothetical protein
LPAFDLQNFSVGYFGDLPESSFAEFFGEIGESIDEFLAFAGGVEVIKILVGIVLKHFLPGAFRLAGESLHELADGFESSGFFPVDAFELTVFGEKVEDDEDLFFREDVFFFALGRFCGLFFDDRMHVEFVF